PAFLPCSELEVAELLLRSCASGALAVKTHRDARGRGGGGYLRYVERRASSVSSCLGRLSNHPPQRV
ncbi:MAG: hypothetical protein AAF355_12800, partial [Myxococcota bacterium]